MNNRFVYHLAVTSALGVTASIYPHPHLVIFILLYFLLVFLRFPFRFHWFGLLIFFGLFLAYVSVVDRMNMSTLSGEEISLSLQLDGMPSREGDRLSGFARLDSGEKLWFTYTIKSLDEARFFDKSILTGRSFNTSGKLMSPLNPTVENGFDFKTYLRYKRIHFIYEIDKMSELDESKGGVVTRLSRIREREIKRIRSHYPEPAGSFTEALIFGEQANLPHELYEQFQKLGIVHILALSGAQVGLVAFFFFYLCIRLGLSRSKAALLVASVIPLYAIMTGLSPSIIRASSMATLFFLAQAFGIRLGGDKVLAICFILYLIIDPYQLFQAGFQLSFVLTYALVLSSSLLRDKNPFVLLLSITAICQIVSLPIVIYHFYEVSLIGFLSNLLFVPLFSFLLFPATAIVYGVVLVDFLKDPAMWLLNAFYQWMESAATFLSDFPFAVLLFGKPSMTMSAVIFLSLMVFLARWERRSRGIWLSGLLLVGGLFIQYNHSRLSGEGEVTFVDIGQGDATLIKLPYEKGVYLIDAGGAMVFEKEKWAQREEEYDPGEAILVPFLKSKGIKRIDKFIVTHADQDHIGGGIALLRSLSVRELVIPFEQRESFRRLPAIEWAVKEKIPIQEVQAGMGWRAGEAVFNVLHPSGKEEEKNESSIVIKASIAGLDWLFAGDLGHSGEETLMSQGRSVDADILKVGHHGSKNSSAVEFIRAVSPVSAVISSGRNNRFGHPHKEVIDILSASGVAIYRTDLQGSISYRFFEGETGTLLTYPP
ncbi:DNA internalization-related competence protein ComEC/Rec2 [Pradoshia sp.]